MSVVEFKDEPDDFYDNPDTVEIGENMEENSDSDFKPVDIPYTITKRRVSSRAKPIKKQKRNKELDEFLGDSSSEEGHLSSDNHDDIYSQPPNPPPRIKKARSSSCASLRTFPIKIYQHFGKA